MCPNWIVPGADMESTYLLRVADIVDATCLGMVGDRAHVRRDIRNWYASRWRGWGYSPRGRRVAGLRRLAGKVATGDSALRVRTAWLRCNQRPIQKDV
jgi:hypothetical protein